MSLNPVVQVQSPKPEPNRAWTVVDLLKLTSTNDPWIVEGLLRPAAQMILAGPPKSGKSMLAADIALSLARPFAEAEVRYLFGSLQSEPKPPSGAIFPTFKVTRPEDGGQRGWRVVYFSLEMQPAEVAERLRMQLPGHGISPGDSNEEPPAALGNISLKTVFGLNLIRDASSKNAQPELTPDLHILISDINSETGRPAEKQNDTEFDAVRDILKATEAEIVVYDTLIQLHDLDENNNILMKSLMRTLRRLTMAPSKDGEMRQLAHIVIHHTRKEGQQHAGPLSADSLRGAGAVHAVADLLMMIRPLHRGGVYSNPVNSSHKQLEVHVSSRYSEVANFVLEKNATTQTFLWKPKERNQRDPEFKSKAAAACVNQFIASKSGWFRLDDNVVNQLIRDSSEKAGFKTGRKLVLHALESEVNSDGLLSRPANPKTTPKKYVSLARNLSNFEFRDAKTVSPTKGIKRFIDWMDALDSDLRKSAPPKPRKRNSKTKRKLKKTTPYKRKNK